MKWSNRACCLWLAGAAASFTMVGTAQAVPFAQEGFGEYTTAYPVEVPYGYTYNHPGPNTGFSGFTDDGSFVPYGQYTPTAGDLTYSNLLPVPDPTPQHLAGNGGGLGIQANIDTSAGGLFAQNGYVTGSTVGTPGKTLYFSYVFQVQPTNPTSGANTGTQEFLALRNNGATDFSIGQQYEQNYLSANGVRIDSLNSNTHFVVLKVDYATTGDTVTLYYDPNVNAPEASQTITDTFLNTPLEFNNIQFKTQGNQMNYDSLRFGKTFADVVPEPASLISLSAAAGMMMLRRRRIAK